MNAQNIHLKILFALLVACCFSVKADTQKQEIKIKPKFEGIKTRPHAPAYIPIQCQAYGDMLSVTVTRPAVVNAEVYVTSTSETVADYFSTEPAETHILYIEPQNDYLTIDIEVDGRMFTGEFFH